MIFFVFFFASFHSSIECVMRIVCARKSIKAIGFGILCACELIFCLSCVQPTRKANEKCIIAFSMHKQRQNASKCSDNVTTRETGKRRGKTISNGKKEKCSRELTHAHVVAVARNEMRIENDDELHRRWKTLRSRRLRFWWIFLMQFCNGRRANTCNR